MPTRVVPGQRVYIDRWAKLVHGLGTWQAVAFREPSDPDELTVKRIVAAGPGRVAIQDGDVYLNGRIQQKNLAQLRELRILVHDDHFRSPLANRWQPAQSTSRWKPTSTGYAADLRVRSGSVHGLARLRAMDLLAQQFASRPPH